jgi:hypothetical protein
VWSRVQVQAEVSLMRAHMCDHASLCVVTGATLATPAIPGEAVRGEVMQTPVPNKSTGQRQPHAGSDSEEGGLEEEELEEEELEEEEEGELGSDLQEAPLESLTDVEEEEEAAMQQRKDFVREQLKCAFNSQCDCTELEFDVFVDLLNKEIDQTGQCPLHCIRIPVQTSNEKKNH